MYQPGEDLIVVPPHEIISPIIYSNPQNLTKSRDGRPEPLVRDVEISVRTKGHRRGKEQSRRDRIPFAPLIQTQYGAGSGSGKWIAGRVLKDVQSRQKGVSTQLSAHQGPVQNLLGKSRARNKQKPQKSLASKALLCWAERGLSEPFCGPDSSFHAEFYHT